MARRRRAVNSGGAKVAHRVRLGLDAQATTGKARIHEYLSRAIVRLADDLRPIVRNEDDR
jgi:hypothetical protein